MKYNITWCERKHIESLGKDVIDINATDEQGNAVKFSVWPEFPNFEGIMNGGTIEGNLWEKPGTGKFTLYPPKPATTGQLGGNKGGFKANMEKTMEKKAEYIEKAQGNKENGIKVSSTIRDAVQITLAELGNNADHEDYERRIQYWRKWLWFEWEKTNEFPPFA